MAKIDKIIQKFNKAKNAINTIKGISSKIEALGYSSAIDELGEARFEAEKLLKKRQSNLISQFNAFKDDNGNPLAQSGLTRVKGEPEKKGVSLIYPKYDPLANYITFDIRPRKDRTFSGGKFATSTLTPNLGEPGSRVQDSPYHRRQISLYIPDTLISQANVGYRAESIGSFPRSVANILESIGTGDLKDTLGTEVSNAVQEFFNMTVNRLGSEVPNLVQGIAKNPQQEQLLDSVPFRSWDFTFDFYPRNKDEAEEVRQIIKVFRQSMLPDTFRPSGKNAEGELDVEQVEKKTALLNATYFNYPNIFDIYFHGPIADKVDGFLPTVCTNAQVDYTGGQKFSTFYDGTPNHIQLTLNFLEIKTLTLGNYEKIRAEMAEGGFGPSGGLDGDSILDEVSKGNKVNETDLKTGVDIMKQSPHLITPFEETPG